MSNSQSFETWQKYNTILANFDALGLSVSGFIINLIQFDQDFMSNYGYLINDLFEQAGSIFIVFAQHHRSSGSSLQWSKSLSTEIYRGEVRRLTEKSSGFHFNVSKAQAQQISRFASGELTTKMETLAPHLWGLMKGLLMSDGVVGSRIEDESKARMLDLVCLIHICTLWY